MEHQATHHTEHQMAQGEHHDMGSTNAMAISATLHCLTGCAMAPIPGAMEAGLVNPVLWLSMMLALTVAYFAAWPVNRYLLARGKGHALTHGFHGAEPVGARRFIPDLATTTLVATIVAFMLGGLVVSIADELEAPPETGHAAGAR